MSRYLRVEPSIKKRKYHSPKMTIAELSREVGVDYSNLLKKVKRSSTAPAIVFTSGNRNLYDMAELRAWYEENKREGK